MSQLGDESGSVGLSDWLHKALCGAAESLQRKDYNNAKGLVNAYFRTKIAMLQRQGVTKLRFVLDGADLPGKAATNGARQEKRQAALDKITQLKEKYPNKVSAAQGV
jgi:hypothetical protein